MNFYKSACCLFIVCLLSSCIATKNKGYTFNQKYSAAQAKEDIVVLQQIYQANHPSLYWYTPKDTIDKYFAKAINNINDSITETQLKNTIAFILAKIKCGHTSVRYSTQFLATAPKYAFPQFPLSIKTWQDSMVVLGYYNKTDSALKPGTIITKINQQPAKEILDNMFHYLCSDGEANNFKSQSLSNNFPAWYRNIYGIDSTYIIDYLDSNKIEKSITIKAYKPTYTKVDSSKKTMDSLKIVLENLKKNEPSKKQKKEAKTLRIRNMVIDTSTNTAFIRLTTFTHKGLRRFINKSFKEIDKKMVQNVVFDIRENGGGRVNNAIHLLQYLKDSAFKISDSTYAINRKLQGKKHIKHWLQYWLMMNLFSHKKADGYYHNTVFENKYYQPFKKHHFNKKIYIVQGGFSFSAATIFSSFLKGQNNVTIVGEESGGAFYGNSAMNIPDIILPNSKLKVRLPLYRYIMNKERPKGRGVMPDITVEPSSQAIRNKKDLKLEKVIQLIKENKQNF
jgi:C-terminal processing protease CtpA/Prc